MAWAFLPSIFPLSVTIKKLSNTESFFIFTPIGARFVIVLSISHYFNKHFRNKITPKISKAKPSKKQMVLKGWPIVVVKPKPNRKNPNTQSNIE